MANFAGTLNVNVAQDGTLLKLKEAEAGNVVAGYTLFTPRILDQVWTTTKYYSSEEDGLVDVLPGSVVTLEMVVDGRLSGSAGCNSYWSAYDDMTSDSFTIVSDMATTRMGCGRPDNVMKQEHLYLQNFDDGRRVQ